MPTAVRQALQAQGLDESALSVVVMRRDGGPPRLAWRDAQLRVPGSTIKTVTTLVGLEQLGPAFRWHTEFLADEPPREGVLRGPLYVRGDGDPDFTAERLQAALRELRVHGVRSIEGDLVLDRRAFDPPRPERDAPPFDESPDAYYNVVPDALLLHGNLLFLHLQSDATQLRAAITAPAVDGVRLDTSEVQLHDGPCTQWEAGWRAPITAVERSGPSSVTVLRLQGRFPRDCTARTETSALERNRYWQAVAGALWKELGGQWSGEVRDGAVPARARSLLVRRSDPLAEIVRRINKPSDNTMARLLYLTLGAQRLQGQGGDTGHAADAVVRDWFGRQGLSVEGLVNDNGSGLSRRERVTAMQLAGVLRAGARSDWSPEFAASLPIVGVDGTMRRRLKDTAAEGRARIKTGTLKDVVGVAGYVRDRARQEWIVVALVNHPQAGRSRPVLDALIEWVAATPLRASPRK